MPVKAIVGYSEPRDIETVLIGGHFRKEAGTLSPTSRNGRTISFNKSYQSYTIARMQFGKGDKAVILTCQGNLF